MTIRASGKTVVPTPHFIIGESPGPQTHARPDVPGLSVAYVRVTRKRSREVFTHLLWMVREPPRPGGRVVVPMADIWVAAAWVIPIFAGATGALLFGYFRFFRWSQVEERQVADFDAAVRTVAHLPARRTRGDARVAA